MGFNTATHISLGVLTLQDAQVSLSWCQLLLAKGLLGSLSADGVKMAVLRTDSYLALAVEKSKLSLCMLRLFAFAHPKHRLQHHSSLLMSSPNDLRPCFDWHQKI